MHDLLDSHSALATEMNAALGTEKPSIQIKMNMNQITEDCHLL